MPQENDIMAGIGFALRRLAQRGSLSAVVQGYGHAAFVTAGPWLFTVLCIGALQMVSRDVLARADVARFVVIGIYDFSFSLVLSGPIVLVLTRHLADSLFVEEPEKAPGMLAGGLVLLWTVQMIVGLPFAVFVLDLSIPERILFLASFLLIGGIWLACVFLSVLKSFEAISFAFALGMLIAFLAGAYLLDPFGAAGALTGFTLGLLVILYALLGRILAEFPYPAVEPFAFLRAFPRYWELACAGFLYNAAIWVDKWIMWLSPGGIEVAKGLRVHPAYDGSMFLAYLTILPALVLFLVSVETRFFERYVAFYRDVQNHATLRQIQADHRAILAVLAGGFRNLAVTQGVICYLAVLVAPGLIGLAKGGLELVPVFRFGVLGALFHTLLLFTLVLISYFDLRRLLLWTTLLFFVLNAGLTVAFVPFGPAFAGYGYFIASLVSLVAAYGALAWCLKRLPYLTFIANNPGLH
jgi:polysaccharide biosynthesis protein PelG